MRKLNYGLIFTFLFGLICWVFIGIAIATTFSDTYDTNTPQGSDNPAEADDRMREIKAAVQERENVDHYWPLTGTEVSDADAGEHRKVLFHEPITSPATVAESHGQLFIKDVAAKAELHWIDEDEQEIQLTSAGSVLLTSGLIPNNVFLEAIDFAGTGTVNIIGVNVSDEVVIFHETAHPAQLSSSDAPVSDEDIANKKYVDDRSTWVPAVTGAGTGYADEESITFPNGLIMKVGRTALTAQDTVITFGDPFDTTLVSVVATLFATGTKAQSGYIKARDLTGFTMRDINNVYDFVEWIAIGR